MKQLHYLYFLLISLVFSACHLQMESTYYADKTSSGSLHMKFDQMLTEQMKSTSDTGEYKYDGKNLSELPREWINLYEFANTSKDGKLENISEDSILFLKLIDIKFDIVDNQFTGIGYRIQRTDTATLAKFNKLYSSSNPTKGMQTDTAKNVVPEGLDAHWDGEKLIIPIVPFDDKLDNDKKSKKKEKEDDEMDMVASILKIANFTYTYTYRFEKKIKKIEGKNSLVKKIDDYTVVYKFDMKEMLEKDKKGKGSKDTDKEIVVYTVR